MQGAQEVPPNASEARGTVIVQYDTSTKQLALLGDYQNLTTAITGSHIHGPFGPPGTNAGVLVTLTNTGGTTGTINGTATLTPAQEADLLAGNMYVNVHSGTYPGGEIRGQLIPTSAGETQLIMGSLNAGQSVATPPVSSSGTGNTMVVLDRLTNRLFLTGSFSGLTSNISNAHIHAGNTGTNGSVVVPLFYAGTTAGTLSGTSTIRATLTDSIINGLTYVNIHTSTYPSGEIRGQLGDLVLPVKLGYFNGYSQGNKVVLVWEALTEQQLKHYEVEQQNTANGTWVKKQTVVAKGTSPAAYKTEDLPENFNQRFVNYRLKMEDKDGRFNYSPIVKINIDQKEAILTIKPNPVKDVLVYQVTGFAANNKADVSILDQNGRRVYYQTTSTFANQTVNVSSLARGVYTLVVKTNEQSLQTRFVKQ